MSAFDWTDGTPLSESSGALNVFSAIHNNPLFPKISSVSSVMWLSVFIVLAIGVIGAAFWRRKKIDSQLEANKDFELRQRKGYAEAKASLEKLKDRISRQTSGSMVIDIIHDLGGFIYDRDRDNTPKRITFEQAIEVMNAVRSTKKNGPVAVIVHTLGGNSLASELIAAALKSHSGPTSVYVPYIAMSGGTMVALAANKIHLGKNASLGPIGNLYWGYSFNTYKKLIELKKEAIEDEIALDYFEAETENKFERARIQDVLNSHHEERALDALLKTDVPHDYRITYEGAGKSGIGLNVSDKCPSEIYQYVELRLLMIRKFEDTSTAGKPASSAFGELAR